MCKPCDADGSGRSPGASKRGVFAHISDSDVEDWQSSIDIGPPARRRYRRARRTMADHDNGNCGATVVFVADVRSRLAVARET